MVRRDMPQFEDWEAEKIKEEEFIAVAEELEPGYQVARLRILRGLTQTQLAAVGCHTNIAGLSPDSTKGGYRADFCEDHESNCHSRS
jgi:hypothetical protein